MYCFYRTSYPPSFFIQDLKKVIYIPPYYIKFPSDTIQFIRWLFFRLIHKSTIRLLQLLHLKV